MVDKMDAGMESYWVDPMVVVKAVKTADQMAAQMAGPKAASTAALMAASTAVLMAA